MKFSYPLLKKFVPALVSKRQAIETLTMHAFESEDAGGTTIEVKLPPNRYADASGHLGIARELAAALGKSFAFPQTLRSVARPKPPRGFSVTVRDHRCTRYVACEFTEVRVATSPAWLQTALIECGFRPISNVVDVMNYVMLETGQPLHAFDLELLQGKSLAVRGALKGESMRTIDGTEVVLPPGTLVIADKAGPVAIAGVKGGKRAEVGASTTRILVEAATFDSASIYETVRSVGITTDASQRFAHGMSPSLPPAALARAAELLEEVVGASRGESFDSRSTPFSEHFIKLDPARYEALIGGPIKEAMMKRHLIALGFTPLPGKRWKIPPLRIDIETHEDLIEELARLEGYATLSSRPPYLTITPPAEDQVASVKSRVRTVLQGAGFDEVYLDSFVSRTAVAADADPRSLVMLENPMSEEAVALRPSLLVNLLDAAARNASMFPEFGMYEVGAVCRWKGRAPEERVMAGLVLAARGREPFFELKGTVAAVLEGVGVREVRFLEETRSPESPLLASARFYATDAPHTLLVEAGGVVVGFLGASRRAMKQHACVLAELDLTALAELASGNMGYRPLSPYPSITRDLSVIVSRETRIGEILRAAQRADLELIEDVDLFDEYTDPSWQGKQGITIRVVLQADDRTLTAREADEVMDRVARTLQEEFGAEFR
jgi:phenylalanyl-tRNA synthetase beta chain